MIEYNLTHTGEFMETKKIRVCGPQTPAWRRRVPRFLALSLLAAAGVTCQAADWSATNVQVLYGTQYADDFGIDDEKKAVFTFEHANGWAYGDNFFFMDVSNATDRGTSYYAEFSPRLSLGKITGKKMSAGIVKDVLVAGTLEMGEDLRAYLLGIGLALDLPKFAFADINLYARQSKRDWLAQDTDTGAQVTIDWLLPFKLGTVDFAFEGFADYAWGEKGGSAPKANNLITAPRLLVNIGSLVSGKPGSLQAGVEYQIWRNKFGIEGVDEDVPQIMVKWTM
jgi:nucleoside-specific outer membrane channel protein Tsx